MILYTCEYNLAFGNGQRLILFRCPANYDPYHIAIQLKKPGELVSSVREATEAMGLPTQFVDISYSRKKRRKQKYGYYKKKK